MWFSGLSFLCLLCCSHTYYSLLYKKIHLCLKIHHLDTLADGFGAAFYIVLKTCQMLLLQFQPSHPAFYPPFTIINFVAELPDV